MSEASIGAAASTPPIAGRAASLAAPIAAAGTPQASPIASSQAAVPSTPTGAEPTTVRPAASNSRTEAV